MGLGFGGLGFELGIQGMGLRVWGFRVSMFRPELGSRILGGMGFRVQASDLVVSLNKGTPIWTPDYYHPCYEDPQNGTPNFGNPH